LAFKGLKNHDDSKQSNQFKQTGHVARIGEMRNAYEIYVGKLKGRFDLGNVREDRRIIKSDRKVIGLMLYNKIVLLEMCCNTT